MKKSKKLPADPVVASQGNGPEFVDHKGLFALFGIGRSLAYVLTGEGKIRSVSLRRKGYTRGKRLWDCASVRKYFEVLMIGPLDDNDRRQAKSNYLHFENDDVSTCDIYFDTFEEAVDFINDHDWSFVTEDWEPAGLFEAKIPCADAHGTIVGQLLKLTIKFTEE